MLGRGLFIMEIGTIYNIRLSQVETAVSSTSTYRVSVSSYFRVGIIEETRSRSGSSSYGFE